jgi:general secretion pathway protein E
MAMNIAEHIGELPEFSGESIRNDMDKKTREWMAVLDLQGERESLVAFDPSHADYDIFQVKSIVQQLQLEGRHSQSHAVRSIVLTDIRHGKKQEESSVSLEKESPYRTVFTDILTQAIEMKASDIHVEARINDATVRLAIPGGKITIKKMTSTFATSMIRFLYDWEAGSGKGSSEGYYKGDIQPQKARIEYATPLGTAELRVQITPAFPEGGVDMVIRILLVRSPSYMAQLSKARSLESLGYLFEDIANIRNAVHLPNGSSIWAGVVNSGKSTSIANIIRAAIAEMRGRIKVVTLEDPPETEILGATQIPVDKMRLGLEMGGVKDEIDGRIYAEGIKIALRMDIDKLFIGEIRGAEMAVPLTNAIRSGHYVFATIHAGSSVEALGRLWNLGLDIMDLASPTFVNLVVYQKLVPALCEHCRIAADEFPTMIQVHSEKILAWYQKHGITPTFFKRNPEGCGAEGCHSGIASRKLIAETFFLTDDLRVKLLERNLVTLRRAWIESGGRPIAHHGLLRVGAGEVDMEDLLHEGVRWPDMLEWVTYGTR